MLIQISSCNGSTECERAVVLLTRTLQREAEIFNNHFQILRRDGSSVSNDAATLILVETDCETFVSLNGIVKWNYTPSNYSTNQHTWEVLCVVIPNSRKIKQFGNSLFYETVHRMHCYPDSPPQYQQGIRVTHLPTGLFTESYAPVPVDEQRTDAFHALIDLLQRMEEQAKAGIPLSLPNVNHVQPVRVYRGAKFRRVS